MDKGAESGIGEYNYDAYSLETKHGWMWSGPGGGAAHGFGEALA
jgi:hypothetical protein